MQQVPRGAAAQTAPSASPTRHAAADSGGRGLSSADRGNSLQESPCTVGKEWRFPNLLSHSLKKKSKNIKHQYFNYD